jgi:hypothetical protein
MGVLGIGLFACTVPVDEGEGQGDGDTEEPEVEAPSSDGSCAASSECEAGLFCAFSLGVCGGPGVCTSSEPIAECPPAPVCGCDGITYPSGCDATRAGVSIVHEGACQPPVPEPEPETPACGGVVCGEGEFCDFSDGTCGAAGMQAGTCVSQFGVCTAPSKPACGCDGQTYDNLCAMREAGISLQHLGACGGV